jgi:HK97 family phage major capsid protein
MMGIAYATGRSLSDAPALGTLIENSFASEFSFKIDDEIFRGTGGGQCLGLYPGGNLGSATVQQAKEGGQAVDTVVAANVQKMFAHIPPRLLTGAVWIIGNEVWPQLFGMNQANMPVFMPGISMANAPYGTLLGRPIVPIEQASAIGDLGDITFANLAEYLIIEKGGLQTAQSMHVRFLYDEMTFRFIYRINGKPAWKSALTPYKGAFTLSPFVGLEAR